MYAHYFSTRKRHYLVLSQDVKPHSHEIAQSIDVSGKRDARSLAKKYNAKPWNF